MPEEVFYDPEDVSRSWTELNIGTPGIRTTPPLLEYLELLESVRWMLPRVMAYYSEQDWCAGWLVDLEKILPDRYPQIGVAAKHLGSICTYWDGSEGSPGEWGEF
jgi:hypothetical protein